MTLEQLPPNTTGHVLVDVLYQDTEARFFAVQFRNAQGGLQSLEVPYDAMAQLVPGRVPEAPPEDTEDPEADAAPALPVDSGSPESV